MSKKELDERLPMSLYYSMLKRTGGVEKALKSDKDFAKWYSESRTFADTYGWVHPVTKEPMLPRAGWKRKK